MSFQAFYQRRVTYVEESTPRLDLMARLIVDAAPASVLDVGCGAGLLLDRLAGAHPSTYAGVDAAPAHPTSGWSYRSADFTRGLPAADGEFQLVVAGEVIEHVPDPDALLAEVHRVLAPGGTLVISTPNLVCWANRLLVPLGVQPLFTETSSQVALGRRLRALGQGNEVQGHLKVFTSRSLAEILHREGFVVERRFGTPFAFPGPLALVDRLACRRVSWASGLVYVARRSADGPQRVPAARPRPLTPSGRRRRTRS